MSSCLHAACVGIDVHVDVAWNVCSRDEKVFFFCWGKGEGFHLTCVFGNMVLVLL